MQEKMVLSVYVFSSLAILLMVGGVIFKAIYMIEKRGDKKSEVAG